ncbi:MAG: penicillin-binding protein activator LpoB, partial [Patescibacteria group bacterium]
MKKLAYMAVLSAVCLAIAACSSKVRRIDTKEVTDLSGRWNDTDSRLVSEEMIKDVMSRPWIDNFQSAKGKQPTVIVGTVANKSHEHINTQTFIKDLDRELINSG